MKEIPAFILIHNGELHDFEVTYAADFEFPVPFRVENATHIVRQSKSLRNALSRFNRAVPRHGPIKRIRKVLPK